MSHLAALEHIRNGIKVLIGLGFVWGLGGLLAMALQADARSTPLGRAYEVVVIAYILGPGLVVNTLLKTHWGRARPEDIKFFGGEKTFSLPFEISDQCTTNCSFVSGEGAGITAMFFSAALIFWVRARAKLGLRGWLILAPLGVICLLGLGLRLAKGRHFFSDSLFAVLLVALIFAVLLSLPRYRDLVATAPGVSFRFGRERV